MIQRIKKIADLISNMGLYYLGFRVFYLIKSKLKVQKRKFPTQPNRIDEFSLNEWREHLPPFFFLGKEIKNLKKAPKDSLKTVFENIQKGIFIFFNKMEFDLGLSYDWITNPSSKYTYDISKHWSEIEDLSETAGDIKYVWEKARFSYFYDVIRYDYHFDHDQSEFVFSEIESFLNSNPINQGPNYKCSQEISLRILNWTFALYYYKDSKNLTQDRFSHIMNSIYWQLHHVYENINFSRIAVRNNHAITETLMLYLSGKLFPFMSNVDTWSKKGKRWFEKEISYQIYKDGTFLQFSMNYHRVAVQLLTWGIRLSELYKDPLSEIVYDRAKKSLDFLDACSDPKTGKLPNYGSNDGALFFKLTDTDYRNYRSQLDDLRAVLYNKIYFYREGSCWYGVTSKQVPYAQPEGVKIFDRSGYYIAQEGLTKTFIRCGAYKDRPFQSDNLHLDIWVKGVNVLRDSGSYKYNTSKEEISYFNGAEGHNTLSLDRHDQMQKGQRFTWFYWVKKAKGSLLDKGDHFFFEGFIQAFKHVGSNIKHHRQVRKVKGIDKWIVRDYITHKKGKRIYQYWHIPTECKGLIAFKAQDSQGVALTPLEESVWYSGYYGVKEKSTRITFSTIENEINTEINIQKL